MSTATRLARLEGSLGPLEAVLLWLGEAHAFPTLSSYADWLAGQPLSVAPLASIPLLVEMGVRGSMRGQKGEIVEPAVDRALGDAVLRIMLVSQLNVDAETAIRIGRLRYTALFWELRAITAESAPAGASRDARSVITVRSTAWRDGLAGLLRELYRFDASRRLVEATYLDGRAALFSDTDVDLSKLRERTERLAALGGPAMSPGTGRRRSARPASAGLNLDALRVEARSKGAAVVSGMVDPVRAMTLDILSDLAGAASIRFERL